MLSLISTQQKLNLLSPGSGKEKTGNDNVGKMKASIDIFTIHRQLSDFVESNHYR